MSERKKRRRLNKANAHVDQREDARRAEELQFIKNQRFGIEEHIRRIFTEGPHIFEFSGNQRKPN